MADCLRMDRIEFCLGTSVQVEGGNGEQQRVGEARHGMDGRKCIDRGVFRGAGFRG